MAAATMAGATCIFLRSCIIFDLLGAFFIAHVVVKRRVSTATTRITASNATPAAPTSTGTSRAGSQCSPSGPMRKSAPNFPPSRPNPTTWMIRSTRSTESRKGSTTGESLAWSPFLPPANPSFFYVSFFFSAGSTAVVHSMPRTAFALCTARSPRSPSPNPSRSKSRRRKSRPRVILQLRPSRSRRL